jgi:hypothetical protein
MTETLISPQTSQDPDSTLPLSDRSIWKKLLWIVLIALLLRVAGMFLIHSYRVKLGQEESAHIAASLATGKGFSNPFGGETGPTAWLGPVYPVILAAIFKVFGVYTRASSMVALLLNCVLSALTCIPIFFIARRTFGLVVAKWSTWAWALLPYTMYWGIRWVWDTALSALLFALLFMLTLQLASSPAGASAKQGRHMWKWLLWGLLWGVAGLTNTAELGFLPFAGLWICWHCYNERKPFIRGVVASAIVFIAVLSPWIVRNYEVFHKFIPVRGNFGVEFHLGNTPDAYGMWQFWLHPSQNVVEFERYQQLGEVAYVKSKKDQTLQFIHNDPGKFARLTAAHFVYYWSGVPRSEKYDWLMPMRNAGFLASSVLAFWGILMALQKRRAGAWLYALLFLSYPTVYYITFPHARYRHPLDAFILILAAYLIAETRKAVMHYPKTLNE